MNRFLRKFTHSKWDTHIRRTPDEDRHRSNTSEVKTLFVEDNGYQTGSFCSNSGVGVLEV